VSCEPELDPTDASVRVDVFVVSVHRYDAPSRSRTVIVQLSPTDRSYPVGQFAPVPTSVNALPVIEKIAVSGAYVPGSSRTIWCWKSAALIAFVGVHGAACEQSFASVPVGDAYRIVPLSTQVPIAWSQTVLAQSESDEHARHAPESHTGVAAEQSADVRHATHVPFAQ
jgi:hypothetical protein